MARAVLPALLALACLTGCRSTPEPRPLPPMVPDLAKVQKDVDHVHERLAERYPGKKPRLLLSPVNNRTGRVVDMPALNAALERSFRDRDAVELVLLPPEGTPPPPVDVKLRAALIDTPVDDEPGTTIFRVDMVLADGDNLLIAQINGSEWKEKLPPPPEE